MTRSHIQLSPSRHSNSSLDYCYLTRFHLVVVVSFSFLSASSDSQRERRLTAQHDLEMALMAKLRLSDPSSREFRRSFEKEKSDKCSRGGGAAGGGPGGGGGGGGGGGSDGASFLSPLIESAGGTPTRNRREERANKTKSLDTLLHMNTDRQEEASTPVPVTGQSEREQEVDDMVHPIIIE